MTTLPGSSSMWLPHGPLTVGTVLTSAVFVLDAASEVASLVCRAPYTGTLDKFAAIIGAVSNAPDNGLRFSFQDIDLATGLPDAGADQSATVASGSVATGWLDPGAFSGNRSVTRGDYLGLVVDIPSFTAGDNVAVQGQTLIMNGCGFPYGVQVTATKITTTLPQFFAHYTDNGGYWVSLSPFVWPALTVTSANIDIGTTPDEVGLLFQVPFPCVLNDVIITVQPTAAAADFQLILYDASNNELANLSHDGDVTFTAASLRPFYLPLASAVTLSPNTTYRLIMKPTSLNNVALQYATLPADGLSMIGGGTNFCMTQRTDAGGWTDFNNGGDGYRRPSIWLGVSAVVAGGPVQVMQTGLKSVIPVY